MDLMISTTRDRLDRKEAATYITARYFPCSKASLDKHAVNETGPDYSVVGPNGGGLAFYLLADLDSWCQAQFRKPANRKKRDFAERKLAAH